jgi:hypothetical protein
MNTGSPQLVGVRNPFNASVVGGGFFVLAPPPSGSDDFATLQALVNRYNPLGVKVRLQQGIYLTSAEIIPAPGFPLRLVGAGHVYGSATKSTTIKLTAPSLRSVIALTENYSWIVGIRIDANRLANYGIYVQADVSHLIDGATTNALLDGVHCSPTGIDQAIETSYLFSYENGQLHATAGIRAQYIGITSALVLQPAITGTAATTAGNQTIVFSGAPDLTTLGIRMGDVLRVGSTAFTAYFGQIKSVTATTIDVQDLTDNRPTITAAGLEYAIGIGWGWFEELNGGAGFCYLNHSWFRANGAGGVWSNSLYGDKITDCYADFNCSAGIALGICWNGGSLREPFVSGVYIEGGIGPDYILGNVLDGHIINPGGTDPARIFSICGSRAQIAIHRAGRVESAQLGAPQNFLVHVNNNGGVLRHRTVADYFGGWASLAADKVVASDAAYGNTPTLTGGATAFVKGFGFYDGGAGLNYLLLDTTNPQNVAIAARVSVEVSDAGNYRPALTTVSANVNGVTLNRLAIVLLDPVTGAFVPWTAASIAAGKSVVIRFDGYLK